MSVSSEIDAIQTRLLDAGALWTRAELLDWYNDGYAALLGDSSAVRRFWIEDVPGRVTYSVTFEWETANTSGRTWRFAEPMGDASRCGTSIWEAQFLEGISPDETRRGITQPWERVYSGDTDAHFRFALPKAHDKICRVAWDDRRLVPVAVKQLDGLRGWQRLGGEPIVWTGGLGRVRSYELFELRTDYQQGYDLLSGPYGVPRRPSGTRTYGATTVDIVPNAWAYTCQGDMDAVTHESILRGPSAGVTSDAELADAPGDYPYRFTMLAATDSWDSPSLGTGYYGTQPWEIGNRGLGRTLGVFAWEKLHGAVTAQTSETRPYLSGYGRRITKQSTSYFTTNTWEVEQIEGSTVATVGAVVGCFSWEVLHGATVARLPLGTMRSASSPDRQYLPIEDISGHYGTVRDWKSSPLAVTITQAFVPEVDLRDDGDDEAQLIPAQALKYIRYYVLSRCFGRQGEGHRPDIAGHYYSRYQLGVQLMKRLQDTAHLDRDLARVPAGTISKRPPRVRLPSTFPRIF